MFSTEHWQIKFAYAGFGALLLFIGMLLSPVTAQRDRFGEIECTKLRVVDANGKRRVIISSGVDGGSVFTYGKDGKPAVALGVSEHGGLVSTVGKDGKPAVALGNYEHGGFVKVKGKGEGEAVMAINEYGNGAVSTWDKNGNRQ